MTHARTPPHMCMQTHFPNLPPDQSSGIFYSTMITSHFARATLFQVSGESDDFFSNNKQKEIRSDSPWMCVTFLFCRLVQMHTTLRALSFPYKHLAIFQIE